MFFFAAKPFITASVSLFVIDMITLFILLKFHLRKDYIARNLFILYFSGDFVMQVFQNILKGFSEIS